MRRGCAGRGQYFQLGNFVAFHHSLALGAVAVMTAAKTGHDSQNLRNYMGLPQWVMKPLPILSANAKDIFATPAGRDFMSGRTSRGDLPTCSGSIFRVAQLNEPGLIGIGGWTAGPDLQPIDRVSMVNGSDVIGVGLPASLPRTRDRESEARLMTGSRAFLVRYLPQIAAAYGIGTGWIGLAKSGQDFEALATTSSGVTCRVPLEQ